MNEPCWWSQGPGGQAKGPGIARLVAVFLAVLVALLTPATAVAAPGLCVGPVCGDGFSRSPVYPWQLRLKVNDQRGHHERLVVDCRDGGLSPMVGSVDRAYAAAVARRACRLAPDPAG